MNFSVLSSGLAAPVRKSLPGSPEDAKERRLMAILAMQKTERRKLGCSCPLFLANGRSENPRIDIGDDRDCEYCHPIRSF